MRVFRMPRATPCLLVATIAGTRGVHGVALAPDLGRGYTSNGKADSVTKFDLETLKVIAEAPVTGVFPDAIVYVPAGHRLVTFNGRSNDATVLDARTSKAIGEGTLTVAHEDTADYGPAPAATAEEPHPRPPLVPGTFRILVVEPAR